MHGTHHVAHRLSSSGLPLNVSSFTGAPLMSVIGACGGALPLAAISTAPATGSGAIAAAGAGCEGVGSCLWQPPAASSSTE